MVNYFSFSVPMKTCPTCDGQRGFDAPFNCHHGHNCCSCERWQDCPTCSGTGEVEVDEAEFLDLLDYP